MMLETPKKLAMVHPGEGLFDADDAKNEVPGHTVAFIDGKSIMVGQLRGIRSASAKTDWLDVLETDEHAECSDDDADDDEDRPAVPGTQPACVPPLYALPANWESTPGTSFSSDWINHNDSVLTHPNMQARVSEDGQDEPGQVMDERQSEKSAQCMEQDVLTVTQDLDVYKEVEKVPMNAKNAAEFNKEPIE